MSKRMIGVTIGIAVFFNLGNVTDSLAAKNVTCPSEVKTGTEFPMTDSNKVTWHNSNSINFNIDYKTVCTWKTVAPSKRKEGNVCTYSTFSECSIGGTPVGTKFYPKFADRTANFLKSTST